MKTILHNFALFATVMFFAASCDKNLQTTDTGNEPLVLSASKIDVVLDINQPESNILVFTWTSGTNYNTNRAISYTLELTAENDFTVENTYKVENLERGTKTYSFKAERLNSILLDEFNTVVNDTAHIKARVTASVVGVTEKQISEPVAIRIVPYAPVSKTLFITGSAVPNETAVLMNVISGVAGGFSWQGRLVEGNFKFITTQESEIPSYNKGENDNTLYLRQTESDPDEMFEITSAGVYRITLKIISLTISIEPVDAPAFSTLYFTGVPNSWGYSPFTQDLLDFHVFRYNADFGNGGEFFITTALNTSETCFGPALNGQGYGSDLAVNEWQGTPDNKWTVPAGIYKITLNTRTMKIDITPFTPFENVYLVGDATPNGWDIGNATPMAVSQDRFIFTWTGHLSDGELKFTLDRQSDWNGAWFLATEENKTPTGTEEYMLYSAVGSNPDNKWRINAGTYSITLNQLQQTVIISKTGE